MPGDVGDKAVVDVRVEALRIKLLLVPLTKAIIGFGFGMLSEACVVVVLDLLVSFETVDLPIMATVLRVEADVAVNVLAVADANI